MLYRSRWKKTLHIPSDVGPDTLLSQREAVNLLGVDPTTLRRALKRGEGPPEATEGFVGPQRWFVAWQVVIWRGTITGEGPKTRGEALQWWLKVTPRPNPVSRPSWWKRGERRYVYLSRQLARFKTSIMIIDSISKLPDNDLGNDARQWLFGELRKV